MVQKGDCFEWGMFVIERISGYSQEVLSAFLHDDASK